MGLLRFDVSHLNGESESALSDVVERLLDLEKAVEVKDDEIANLKGEIADLKQELAQARADTNEAA